MATLNRRSRRGFTLVETLVCAALAATVLAALAQLMLGTDAAFRAAALEESAELRVDRTLDRIVAELRGADGASLVLVPAPPLVSTSVRFRRVDGWQSGAVVLGPIRELVFQRDPAELPDGVDNDGDGLVDEGRIVLRTDVASPTGADVVLLEDVRALLEGETADGLDENGNGLVDEPGFCASFDSASGALTLRLSLEVRTRDGRPNARTSQTIVRLRND